MNVRFSACSFGLLCLLLAVIPEFTSCHGHKYIKTIRSSSTMTTYIGQAYVNNFTSQEFVTAKFLGIPYAETPVRFSMPVLATPEDEVFFATRYGDVCQQVPSPSINCMAGLTMSEKCLFLNIYVPVPTLTVGDIEDPYTASTSISTNTSDTSTATTVSTANTTTSVPLTSSPTQTPKPMDDFNESEALVLPSNGTKFAVMVYIHGGAYSQGTGNCYDGSNLAGLGNIIVVSINYRLGPFGFLSTADGVIPGNLGLLDQNVALQWVKKHIEAFGGDPDRITVAGQSSGGSSSILQALSQHSPGLFQRMIAQSGTPAVFKSVSTVGYTTTKQVAESLNCTMTSTSKDIKNCLMNQTAAVLASVSVPQIVPGIYSIQPTLENPLITADPYKMLSQMATPASTVKPPVPDSFTSKDLLIGVAAQDGDTKILTRAVAVAKGNITLLYPLLSSSINPQTFKAMISDYFQQNKSIVVDPVVIEAVLDRYTDWQNPDNYESLSYRAIDMLTDIYNVIPALSTAWLHVKKQENTSDYEQTGQSTQANLSDTNNSTQSQGPPVSTTSTSQNARDVQGKTYVYRFNLPPGRNSPYNVIPWFKGTGHSSDLPYVFGMSLLNNINDVQFSRRIISYWSNFVKTGDPNRDDDVEEVTTPPPTGGPTTLGPQTPHWPQYDRQSEQFLELSIYPEVKSRMRADYRHFWSSFLPQLQLHLQEVYDNGVVSVPTKQCPNNGQTVFQINFGLFILVISVISVFG